MYLSHRKPSTPVYDEAGNMLSAETRTNGTGQTMTFDAAGRQKAVSTISRHRVGIYAMASFENVISEGFDGDGHPLKEENLGRRLNMSPPQPLAGESKYQIWSSVLNLAVTELNNAGAKKTTKIMAGGAVIAEQTFFIGSQVIWKSADPVTGSNIQIFQNGTYYDDQELEPLGQLVSPIEPYEEMEVTQNVALQGADEPEGLCASLPKLGVSFQNLPSVCRDIAIRNGTATFDDLHQVKYTITQVPAGSNHGNGHGEGARPTLKTLTPEERKSARALAASQKPSDTDNETFVDRDLPTTIGADASQAGDQTLYPYHPSIRKRQIGGHELDTLKKNVNAMLDANNGECKRYIEQLLDKAKELNPNGEDGNTIDYNSGLKTHMVLDIFDTVNEQGGFYFAYGNTVNMFQNKPQYNGATVWLVGDNGIDQQTRSGNAVWQKQSGALDSLLAVRAIHELVHYNYNDNQLADAAAALKGKKYSGSGFFGTSIYWDNELRSHCDPTYVSSKK